MAQKAGSLVLERRALFYLPPGLPEIWMGTYQVDFANRAGVILVKTRRREVDP